MNTEVHVFPNAKSEFVLIGPIDGKDKILARSEVLSMELIGYTMEGRGRGIVGARRITGITSMIYSALYGSPSLNCVSSWPIRTIQSDEKIRKESYRLGWRGVSIDRDIDDIEKALNANIIEISEAVTKGNAAELEMALAPVLFRCERAATRIRRTRRAFAVLGIMYGIMFGIAAIVINGKDIIKLISCQ